MPRPATALAILLLCLASSSRAHAGSKDEIGCIGLDEFAEFALLGGKVGLSGTGVEDSGAGRTTFDRKGEDFVVRAHICAVERRTRFGAFMGWDINLEVGRLSLEPLDGDEKETPWQVDFHAGFHAIPFYKAFRGKKGKWKTGTRFDRRLALRAGLGVNVDYAYTYGGLSYSHTLKRESVGVELAYLYVPAGISYSQRAQVREHRPSASVIVEFTPSMRVAFGAEARVGTHARSDGDAPLSQSLVGDYWVALGFISLRLHAP